jgi:hypothetical protein
MKNIEIIIQFIPILIIYALLSYSNMFVKFSFTILGKLIAILIIILYTKIDIAVGIFICGLIILYYQSDYVENMLNIDDVIDIDNIPNFDFDDLSIDLDMGKNQPTNFEDDGIYLLPIEPEKKKTRFSKEKIRRQKKEKRVIEKMSNQKDSIEKFRKQYCNGNELKYKGISVKKDMIEHVFPEINFFGKSCSPCSNNCSFSIIESKLKTEEIMIPISTFE